MSLLTIFVKITLMKTKQFKAFTLIELLVVIAIIGILSALIVVGMSSTNQKATIAKAQVFANSLRNSLMSNLVSEWRFDQINVPAANQTPDSWGGGNTGTLYSAPQLQTTGCVSGNCLSFDGVDDYIEAADNNTLDIVSDLTISVWFKMINNPTGNNRGIIAKWRNQTGYLNQRAYGIVVTPSGYIGASVSTDGLNNEGVSSNSATGAIDRADGFWHHIVLVFDASSYLREYVDGRQEANNTTNVMSSIFNSPAPLWFGVQYDLGISDVYANAFIDDARIFNVAMPTSQIQQNYFAGLNKLLAKNGMELFEYQQHLVELNSNYAEN